MKALICGIGGQDGAYLSKLLLEKGYIVQGTSRDAMTTSFQNLSFLGIKNDVQLVSMALNDFRSVLNTIQRFKPDEVYNLGGQSSVGLSFDQPVESIESIIGGTLNVLEAIRFLDSSIRFYNAGSSECFGCTANGSATEITPFSPRSPYAVAKASSFWLLKNYRDAYKLFACTGILFNHESPLRPDRFVTQKIVCSAARIKHGLQQNLELGNIKIIRDWGWAPEFVEAMWLMLQQQRPEDYIVATGFSSSLEYFVDASFSHFGLNWRDHVSVNINFMRPSDIDISSGCPLKAKTNLGWSSNVRIDDIIKFMCLAAEEKITHQAIQF